MDKIQEMLQEVSSLKGEVRSLIDENKVEDAEAKMKEVRSLEAKIALEEELAKEEERQIETKIEQRGTEGEQKTMEQRQAFINVLRGTATEEERALVQAGVGTDGGYLVPTEEKTSIEEYKRSYKSAKDLVNVMPVSTLKGSYVVEDGTLTELTNFDEDNNGLDDTKQPKFKNVDWKVDAYGAIVPISNTFRQDEQGGFMAYLNRYFAKRAILTENNKIFGALKAGKAAVKASSIDAIKTALNKDLDPAIADNAVVIVNQTAFDVLDRAKDENGRYLLQDNPTQETAKVLQGKPVHVFSDEQLKPVAGRGVAFIGDIEEAIDFQDRGVYEVKISEEAGFNTNKTLARVIERFDVNLHDKDAYVHLEIEEAVAGVEG